MSRSSSSSRVDSASSTRQYASSSSTSCSPMTFQTPTHHPLPWLFACIPMAWHCQDTTVRIMSKERQLVQVCHTIQNPDCNAGSLTMQWYLAWAGKHLCIQICTDMHCQAKDKAWQVPGCSMVPKTRGMSHKLCASPLNVRGFLTCL